MAELDDQRSNLIAQIQQISIKLAARQNLARDECNGVAGLGLTGLRGEGSNCKSRRAEADQFRTDSKIDGLEQALSTVESQIAQLEASLTR